MDAPLIEQLRAWHDVYALVGTAAATLIGLIFIAGSIAASYMTEQHGAGVQAFFSPTVVHFAAVLIICIVVSAPFYSRAPLAGLLFLIGIVGLGYSLIVWVRMGHASFAASIDLSDRLWYAISPLGCHLFIMAAATVLWWHVLGLELLAIGTVLLLIAGIRNAWDITAWAVTRSNRS
jgi:hypothetical protein